MIALIASALLGLYVLLPVFLFDKVAEPFVRLKRHQRTKIEEFVVGTLIAGFPFACTVILSRLIWHVGRWPFFLSDAESVLKIRDYQTVFNGLYSEHFFETHIAQFWASFWRVFHHQARFLSWNYLFLSIEIAVVLLITLQFGRLNQFQWKLAKSERIGIVLLSQLRRPEGGINIRPTMLDLKESGDIEAHSHVVLLPYLPVGEDGTPLPEEQLLIIGKNRNGSVGSLPVVFDERRLQFVERSGNLAGRSVCKLFRDRKKETGNDVRKTDD